MERLLKLLNPPADSGKQPKRYVQEQVITSLAMVADVSEKGFAKVRVDEHISTLVLIWTSDQHYPAIMPLLLSVLQNAQGSEYHKLRLKAMECAGLVGRFRPAQSIVSPLKGLTSNCRWPRCVPGGFSQVVRTPYANPK